MAKQSTTTMTKQERAEARAKARPLRDLTENVEATPKTHKVRKAKKPAKAAKVLKVAKVAKVKPVAKTKRAARPRKIKAIEAAASKGLLAPAGKDLSVTKYKALVKLDEPEGIKPSKEMYAAFQQAYDFLNKRFFASALPQVVLIFARKPRSHGYFHAQRWTSGEATTHELALNPDTMQRSPREVVSTILHEMCHVAEHVNGTAPKKAYHNRAFFTLMKSVGLHCSKSGEVGGPETGAQMTHYIEPNGPFEPALVDLLSTGWKFSWASFVIPKALKKKSRQGARVKYTCPESGLTAWGRGGMILRAFDEAWEDGDDLPPIMQEETPEGYGDAGSDDN